MCREPVRLWQAPGTPSISDYCIPASSLFTIQYPTLDSEIPGFTL